MNIFTSIGQNKLRDWCDFKKLCPKHKGNKTNVKEEFSKEIEPKTDLEDELLRDLYL